MRIALKELMEKLSVGYELSPYETCPWMYYDEEKQITCSAEVRMGPGASDIEAEVQFLMDDDAPYEEEDEGEEETGRTGSIAAGLALGPGEEIEEEKSAKKAPEFPTLKPGMQQQILYMQILPSTGEWKPEKLRIKGKNYVNEVGDWEGRGCEVFTACVQSIMMDELPDIDKLIKEKMEEFGGSGGRRGRIGRKSPKVNTSALLGMKKGM